MKKFLAVLLALVLISSVLASCQAKPKLNSEQQQMLDNVMDNIGMWETKGDYYANSVQLQEIGGEYFICVGYGSSFEVRTNKAVTSYGTGNFQAYLVSPVEFSDAGETTLILPGEMYMWGGIGTGRTALGNTTWYFSESYEEKYETMEALFTSMIDEK